MTNYIAVQHDKSIRLIETQHAHYTPAGWHPPYRYFTLMDLGKPKTRPAQKRPALVSISGLTTKSNNARVLDETTCIDIDMIDNQIKALRRRRQQVIYDRYLTFPLVKEGDIQNTTTLVFNTKKEAIKEAITK